MFKIQKHNSFKIDKIQLKSSKPYKLPYLFLLSTLFFIQLSQVAQAQSTPPPASTGSSANVQQYTSVGCSQAAQNLNDQAAQAAITQDKNTLDQMERNILQSPPSGLLSCIDHSWPTFNFFAPTLEQILQAIKQDIINQACVLANQSIQQAESPLYGMGVWQNISIPGVPGLGFTAGGGAGGTTLNGGGLGSGGVNPGNLFGGGSSGGTGLGSGGGTFPPPIGIPSSVNPTVNPASTNPASTNPASTNSATPAPSTWLNGLFGSGSNPAPATPLPSNPSPPNKSGG